MKKLLDTRTYLKALRKKIDSDYNSINREWDAAHEAMKGWVDEDDPVIRQGLEARMADAEERAKLATALIKLSGQIDKYLSDIDYWLG